MNRTVIIAEAGVNHNGDIENAFKLIDVARSSGADYVKFQTFKTELLTSVNAQKAEYQKRQENSIETTQFSMLKSLELKQEDHFTLKKYAESKGIKFLSTGFDEESIDFLDFLGIDLFKIPSGEISNIPYIKHVSSKGKPIVLSTGMAKLSDIELALEVILVNGINKKDITILHCNTEYPTPYIDVNLLAMHTIKSAFGVQVGYSDHTSGIEVSIAAVALGAVLIEKHFTLDKGMVGPDHSASLNPSELKDLVDSIRNVELAVSGSGLKYPSESEKKNIFVARKSIHLKFPIKAGDNIKLEDLIMLRPGDGISPIDYEKIIGLTVKKDLPAFYKLNWSDLA